MNRDVFLLLAIGILIVVLLARHARAPDAPGVKVQMGTYGARIDYGAEHGGGCCG